MTKQYERDTYVFPGPRFTPTGYVSGKGQGMSVRDWFAGQWVAAGHHRNLTPIDAAEQAYEFADAMLRIRETEEGLTTMKCGSSSRSMVWFLTAFIHPLRVKCVL